MARRSSLGRVGEVITDPASTSRYRLERRLGEGGFGEAWAAIRIRPSGRRVGAPVCVKLTRDQAGWHRECYFGQILAGDPGILDVQAAFVVLPKGRRPLLYALLTELADGTVADLFHGDELPWTEPQVRNRMRPIIATMERLHEQGALHRDVTPWNVFVVGDRLKLGDFGIATHGAPGVGVPANVFNPWFAPRKIASRSARIWTPAADLYQLSNVAALLLDEPERREDPLPMDPGKLRGLVCTPQLKAVLYRVMQPGQFPYRSAAEFAACLAQPPPFPRGRLHTVAGKRIVLTGPMDYVRRELEQAIIAAGGQPQKDVNASTDYVVMGRLSPAYVAENAGTKLLAAMAAASYGCPVKIVSEANLLAHLDFPRHP